MDKLKSENDKLRNNIRTVHKNLQTLKELFINAANTKKESIDVKQIGNILKEIDKLDTVESEHSSDSEDDYVDDSEEDDY